MENNRWKSVSESPNVFMLKSNISHWYKWCKGKNVKGVCFSIRMSFNIRVTYLPMCVFCVHCISIYRILIDQRDVSLSILDVWSFFAYENSVRYTSGMPEAFTHYSQQKAVSNINVCFMPKEITTIGPTNSEIIGIHFHIINQRIAFFNSTVSGYL